MARMDERCGCGAAITVQLQAQTFEEEFQRLMEAGDAFRRTHQHTVEPGGHVEYAELGTRDSDLGPDEATS